MHIDIEEGNPPETGGESDKGQNEGTGKDENEENKEEKDKAIEEETDKERSCTGNYR